MKRFIHGLCLPLLALSALRAVPPPNILIILSDDQSAAHVGAYGNPDVRTPVLDRLAAEGMRFDRAYVTCPQCAPSRASIVTGRSPLAVGMARFSATVAPEAKTTPDHLRPIGFHTGFAGRPYHLDGSRNMPAELKDYARSLGIVTFPNRLDFLRESENDNQAVEQFVDFLDSVPDGKPFYLQLGFSDPHRILTAPRLHDPSALSLPPHYPDIPEVRADLAAYYDEVARLDSNVGRVLAILEERGLAQSTLVMFIGDNGASQFRGKGSLHELGIRVPLIVRWPGVTPSGTSFEGLVSGEDILPTILEIVSASLPDDVTGISFAPALRGSDARPRTELFAMRGAHGMSLPYNSAGFDVGRAVVETRFKLIYNVTWQLGYAPLDFGNQPAWKALEKMHADGTLREPFKSLYFVPQRPMFELYDLESDPWELNNLAGNQEHADIEYALRMKLCKWMMRERDYAPLPIPESRR